MYELLYLLSDLFRFILYLSKLLPLVLSLKLAIFPPTIVDVPSEFAITPYNFRLLSHGSNSIVTSLLKNLNDPSIWVTWK